MTSKNWVFTVHDVDAFEARANEFANHAEIVYMVYQQEVAPTTEKTHIQGYVVFKNAKRMSGVKKVIGEAHLEMRKGTHAEVCCDRAVPCCGVLRRAELICPVCLHFLLPYSTG